ncbi:Zn(II)2Cys6 transcription factor domain-containing protein [Aspergillus mulundensis]|uniref:Putative Zn(II)2Cys6 transcription factor n=1 Tax=Aspergillus mulundensis TaxID=1810919 RepID=A0A3D8RZ10_9EURO|nr:putative Zn(II)2Cys6 transcription factor [Aspergillus mulundensis]RDW79094.1 putative Zn(II)2Cys6 transcription factor [Aspergillus mulundensis]
MASGIINSYTANKSRKSHRKSRLGCGNCKRRRVKCDEKRPECSNCQRHSVSCDYASEDGSSSRELSSPYDSTPEQQRDDSLTFISSSQADFRPPKRRHARRTVPPAEDLEPPVSQTSTAVANKPFDFSAADMAVFHHLMSSKDLGGSNQMAISQYTRLGFSFHYLLHLLLAFSNFHLARHQGDDPLHQILGQSRDYLAEGERHYSIGVGAVAEQIPHLGKENGLALYAATLLIFLTSVARGPQQGEYLAFRSDGQPGSLALFMGIRTVLETCSGNLSIDASVMHPAESKDPPSQGASEPHRSWRRSAEVARRYDSELPHLGNLLSTLGLDHDVQGYHQVFHRLQHIFHSLYGFDSSVEESQLWPYIFGWLYTLPNSFLTALQHREPVALVLFSFFLVLLKELDSTWFLRDWPEHIIGGIFYNLDSSHRDHIRWPMEVLQCSFYP